MGRMGGRKAGENRRKGEGGGEGYETIKVREKSINEE